MILACWLILCSFYILTLRNVQFLKYRKHSYTTNQRSSLMFKKRKKILDASLALFLLTQ